MIGSSHPIAKLLLARRSSGSMPGARSDGRRVALVIEGGGMRGVVAAGMVGALEQLGLTDTFDGVFGASAGAISGAYFLAHQARYGTTIFYEDINNREFINIMRFFQRKPILSLEFLLDQVCIKRKKLEVDRVLNSPIKFNAVATSLNSSGPIVLTDFSSPRELFEALRASARIPFFAGEPVPFRNDLLVDASIFESIPFRPAIQAGYTDMVLLLTRPAGVARSKPGWIDRFVVAPHIRRYNAAAAEAYLTRDEIYADDLREIMAKSSGPSPRFLVAQISNDEPKVSPLDISREALIRAAKAGFRAVYPAFGLPAPVVVEILTPLDALNDHRLSTPVAESNGRSAQQKERAS